MSASDMLAYATIEFGLSLSDSGTLTITKFRKLLKWYNEKVKNSFNERSGLLRTQTFFLMNNRREEKDWINSPSDLWLLLDEKLPMIELPTEEEKKEIAKELGEKIIV